MPLDRNLSELPTQTGLSQKTDPRLIQEGAQTGLVNLVQDKMGALQKRPGIIDLGVGTASLNVASYKSARLIRNVPDGIAQINSGHVFSRSSSGTPETLYASNVPTCLADQYGILSDINPKFSFDLCATSTQVFVGWIAQTQAGSFAQYMIVDPTSFAIVQLPQNLTDTGIGLPVGLRMCMSGTTPVCVVEDSTNTLHILTFTGGAWVVGGSVATNVNQSAAVTGTSFHGCWDICPITGTNNWLCVWGSQSAAGGTPAWNAAIYNGAVPGVSSINNQAIAAAADRMHGITACADTADRVWLIYAYNTGTVSTIVGQALDAAALTASSPGATSLWTETTNNPERLSVLHLKVQPSTFGVPAAIIVGCQANNPPITRAVLFGGIVSVVVTPIVQDNGASPASKLFELNGQAMGLSLYTAGDPTTNNVEVFPSYYVNWYQGKDPLYDQTVNIVPQANVAPRAGTPNQLSFLSGLFMPSVVANSVGANATQSILTLASTIRSSAALSGIDIINAYYNYSQWQPAELGGNTYLSGGVPCEFDGRAVSEIGFAYQPPSTSKVALASSTGGGLSSYTYTYGVVYESLDNLGQRKQSAPTFISFTATGTTSKASITVPALGVSMLYSQVASGAAYQYNQMAVAIYRDTSTSPGTLCRLFTGNIPTTQLFATGSASLVYTDSLSDGTIINNEQLYTTGGVLPAQCPPSLKCLISHNSRLVGIGGDGLIWFSTKWDEGTTVPYFNDNLTQAIGDEARPTALATMDGNLIIFKSQSIWIISGDGPANDGTGNTWTPPQRITADCGCTTDWRSVVTFNAGVVFQNGTKLYLLSRGQEASYFSGPVEDLLIANPVIVSSCLHAARNELRFVCKPTETATSSVVLNFNYVTQTWSQFTYYDSDTGTTGSNIDTAIVIDNTWFHGTFTGRIYQEGTGSLGSDNYYDVASHWVTGTRETAWLKAQGIQGFGRFWNVMVLETDYSPHDLTISAGYNYGSLYADSHTWTASEIASFTTNQPQMQMHLTQQKSESVRIKLTDGPPTGVASTSGQGANIVSVMVESGVKRGRFRIPEAQAK